MNLNENAQKIVSLAYQELSSPYVFGAIGENCTPILRSHRINASHPTVKSSCQALNGSIKNPIRNVSGQLTEENCIGCKWRGCRMYDCRGFTYWLLKQVGILISTVGATTQYRTDSAWVRKGAISSEKYTGQNALPGEKVLSIPNLVFPLFVQNGIKMSHTGMHVGNGVIIDCSTGVTKKTWDKSWSHYAIPKNLYTAEELANAEEVRIVSVLKRGSRGEEVKQLQEMLNKVGYDCGEADGVFGTKTETAVVMFQTMENLQPDGIAGEKTQKALVRIYNEEIGNPPEEEPATDEDPEVPEESGESGANAQKPTGEHKVDMNMFTVFMDHWLEIRAELDALYLSLMQLEGE